MSRISAAIGVVVLALGCTLFAQQRKENMLEAAGFRMVAANTSEKIQVLNNLPAGKIARIDRDGAIYYVFPDAQQCRCLRVGSQEQYDRYLRLASDAKADLLETTGVNTQSENFKGYEPW